MPKKNDKIKVSLKRPPRTIPEGYHYWPLSGHMHSVRDKHTLRGQAAKDWKVPDGSKVHADETEDFYFIFPKKDYKEGEWESIK